MMWHAADGMGWWMVWGGVMIVLFWAVVLGFIALIVQPTGRGRTAGPTDEASSGRSALDIAKQRYAQGEIGRDEFEQLREDLVDTTRSPGRSGGAEATAAAPSTTR